MAATGKWQWMVAVERQSTTEGEDNGGGFRVRRLGQRGRRMCAPLQATRKRGDVDLGKGDDSPHWLSTLSSSPARHAVAAAASSPPLSFPNADLVLRLHLDPCPTTTRISRLARITRRVAAGREDRRRQRGGRRGGGGEASLPLLPPSYCSCRATLSSSRCFTAPPSSRLPTPTPSTSPSTRRPAAPAARPSSRRSRHPAAPAELSPPRCSLHLDRH
ncbi:Os08g0473725 [Oryza sativa Japonica Group]|uniref:Os08g0473725 protein n=1 Tax=Oryza sativa subsp. japonica TaxID=39947 RepID=A0A0P0XHE3_ORYSJ|nr:Os08g0473725 [Oryza sativa Japonica Group]